MDIKEIGINKRNWVHLAHDKELLLKSRPSHQHNALKTSFRLDSCMLTNLAVGF